MTNLKSMVKYTLRENLRTLGIFYIIFILSQLLLVFLISLTNDGVVRISGLSITTSIFLFVLFLCALKAPLRFASANGVSRRTFFLSTCIAVVCVSAVAAGADLLTAWIFRIFPALESGILFPLIYADWIAGYGWFSVLLVSFFWTFLLFTVWAALGFLITSVYYRSNTFVKILISVAPVFLMVVLASYAPSAPASPFFQSPLWRSIGNWIILYLENALAYPSYAMLGFLILDLVLAFFTFLLVRRAPIKD